MIEKPKRIVDEELLATVRRLPCLACASLDPDGARAAITDGASSHPHHVISRGAGGHDTADNVMPLCFDHHREIHQQGLVRMAKRYPVVGNWLESVGQAAGE